MTGCVRTTRPKCCLYCSPIFGLSTGVIEWPTLVPAPANSPRCSSRRDWMSTPSSPIPGCVGGAGGGGGVVDGAERGHPFVVALLALGPAGSEVSGWSSRRPGRSGCAAHRGASPRPCRRRTTQARRRGRRWGPGGGCRSRRSRLVQGLPARAPTRRLPAAAPVDHHRPADHPRNCGHISTSHHHNPLICRCITGRFSRGMIAKTCR